MRKVFCFIAVCFFAFSSDYAQNSRKHLPAGPSEQKEIKADKHLEKELQQKQLSAKPEMLTEPVNKKEPGKKSSEKVSRTRRYATNNSVKKS